IDEVVAYWYQRAPWTDSAQALQSQAAIASQIVTRMIELIQQQGVAKAGVQEILASLQAQDLPLALASSSSPALIDAVLDRLRLRACFRLTHSATQEPYGKPHPAVYLTTAQRLGVSPLHCLAIEDSLNGVLAAKAARMQCIALPENYPQHDPKFVIADYIAPSLTTVAAEILPGLENVL
ncbi:MAG: HAD-IA family hydrolase, partial [Cyanobacteria bacterium P01_H01_bin.121]